MLSTEDLEKTVANFSNMKRTFVSQNSTNPSFSLAARNLYSWVARHVDPEDNNLFLWLEDDWHFDFSCSNEFYSDVTKMFDNPEQISTFLTTRIRYVGGNPLVFRQPLFEEILKVYSGTSKNIDPEFAHMEAQKALENNTTLRVPPKKVLHKILFKDAGRAWRKEHKIGKRKREAMLDETWFPDRRGVTQ